MDKPEKTTELTPSGNNETEDLKKKLLEAIKEKGTEILKSNFGRYVSASGAKYLHIWEQDAENANWKKGYTDGIVEEELVLPNLEALRKLSITLQKGFGLDYKANTPEEFEIGEQKRLDEKSPLERDGLLGDYFKGTSYLRVLEFKKGVYSIERGTGSDIFNFVSNLSENETRDEIKKALENGYTRDENAESAEVNIDELLGLKDTKPQPIEDDGFNPDWLK